MDSAKLVNFFIQGYCSTLRPVCQGAVFVDILSRNCYNKLRKAQLSALPPWQAVRSPPITEEVTIVVSSRKEEAAL